MNTQTKAQRINKRQDAIWEYFAKANNSEQIRNRKMQHTLGDKDEQLAKVTAQRDELLKALKEIRQSLAGTDFETTWANYPSKPAKSDCQLIDDAIAKAESNQT